MRFSDLLKILTVVAFLVEFVECNKKCIVIAPRNLRSNSNYTISLATTGYDEPVKFKIKIIEREEPIANRTLEFGLNDKNLQVDPHDFVTIVGPEKDVVNFQATNVQSTDDKVIITFIRTRTVVVEPAKPRLLTFKIDDLEPGSYLLDVQSMTDPPFHQQRFLYVSAKTASIHIQTDKAIYKPGEQVKYQLLVVDGNTKPIDVKQSLSIFIYDSANNMVGQSVGLSAPHGVYIGTFDIFDDGNLGIWHIEARYKNTKVRKSLECVKYQLPRFQVAVKAPTTISKSDKYLVVAIDAFYLFGKPVCGDVRVKATPIQNRDDFWKENADPMVVKGSVVGKFVAKFPLKKLNKQPITSILLEAEVLELATGVHQRAFDKTVLIASHGEDHGQMSSSSLQVTVVGPTRLDHSIKVQVKSKEKLKSVFYYVVGRGNVLLSDCQHLDGRSHAKIVFDAQFSMAPQSSLVVFYIAKDGKIVSAETKLIFDGADLLNEVKVTVSDKSLEPSNNLAIKVDSNSGSYVSLSLTDQRLRLLRRGNELSVKDVNNELELYGPFGETFTLSDAGDISVVPQPLNLDYKSDILDPITVPWVKKFHKHSYHKEPRSNFQENFWIGNKIGNDSLEFDTPIPDSVTSWAVTGVALSLERGIGVLQHPIIVSTFKPFFIDLILPEIVRRNEKVHVQVVVHNYLHWNAKIFVKLDCEGHDVEIVGHNYKHLRVRANRVRATSFTIVPRELGAHSISVSAHSRQVYDNVVRVMNVEPEGVTIERYITKSFILNASQNFTETMDLQIPDIATPGSVKTQITIQGDKYSAELQNLENFETMAPGFGLNLPFGIAAAAVSEQQFASINKLTCGQREKTEATVTKAEKIIARYQCPDGGFNPEGDCSDPDRDTYFTAQNLVVLLSNNAKYLKNIGLLEKTLDYLARIQREDGSIPELSKNPVPRSFKEGVGLTSYVIFMFVFNEVSRYVPKTYPKTVAKSINYLLQHLQELDDGSLCLLTRYTIVLNHPAKDKVKALLESKIYRSRDSAWFTRTITPDNSVDTYVFGVTSLINDGNFNDGLRLTNGLARSLVATFVDGRVTLNAALTRAGLGLVNNILSLANQTINLTFGVNGSEQREKVHIANSNKSVLQKFKLPNNCSSIDVQARGVGYASVQIKYQYNVPEHEIQARFHVQTHLQATGNDKWDLQICSKFLACDHQTTSNAQMEITFPVGCDTEEFLRDTDPRSSKIHKKRFRDNDLVVEFKELDENEECFVVPIYRKVWYTVQPRVGEVLLFDKTNIYYRTKITFKI